MIKQGTRVVVDAHDPGSEFHNQRGKVTAYKSWNYGGAAVVQFDDPGVNQIAQMRGYNGYAYGRSFSRHRLLREDEV